MIVLPALTVHVRAIFVRSSWIAWGAAACLSSGCGTVARTQFDAISAQNRVLLEQRRTNLAEIQRLQTHARDVEDRLLEAQRESARLAASAPARSDQPAR